MVSEGRIFRHAGGPDWICRAHLFPASEPRVQRPAQSRSRGAAPWKTCLRDNAYVQQKHRFEFHHSGDDVVRTEWVRRTC